MRCGAVRSGLLSVFYRVPTATVQLQVQKSTSATERDADAVAVADPELIAKTLLESPEKAASGRKLLHAGQDTC